MPRSTGQRSGPSLASATRNIEAGHDPPLPQAAPTDVSAVDRAIAAVGQIQSALSSLSARGYVSVPDIKRAVCNATIHATAPDAPPAPPKGLADHPRDVMLGSPFQKCPPGSWAVGRRVGDPHLGPLCHCGVHRCKSHFDAVDIFELYDMHCTYVCQAHRIDSAGALVDPVAHAACEIHTKLTILSGVWVPWLSDSHIPTQQLRAPHKEVSADSPEGVFILGHIEKGLKRGLFERVTDHTSFEECAIIESAFDAIAGKIVLTEAEVSSGFVVDERPPDVAALDVLARARAQRFMIKLRAQLPHGTRADRPAFNRTWVAQGNCDKHRLCIGHDEFLNKRGGRWRMSFITPHTMLESSQPGDVYLTIDHESGYSVVTIRKDQRRFFCFRCPVTGLVYRCLRLDFGWALSPGIFCSFTAETNAIIAARLSAAIPRALCHYYIDDQASRVTPGGPPAIASLGSIVDRPCTENERMAIAILDDVSRRANFPRSDSKARWGPALVYLGLYIDSSTRTATVIASKLLKSLTMLHAVRFCLSVSWAGLRCVPRAFIEKLCGNAQWLAECFHLARLYTPALWYASNLLKSRPNATVDSCPGFAHALEWWATSAAAGNLLPHRFIRAIDIPSVCLRRSVSLLCTRCRYRSWARASAPLLPLFLTPRATLPWVVCFETLPRR